MEDCHFETDLPVNSMKGEKHSQTIFFSILAVIFELNI